jgi:hypothetical protein
MLAADRRIPLIRQWRRLRFHELTLIGLGVGTSVALLGDRSTGRMVFWETFGVTILYGLVLGSNGTRNIVWDQRIRFLASFGFVLWFYCAVNRITPALGIHLCDATLLGIDQSIFGVTPSVALEKCARKWLTDLLSICYLTYHAYIGIAIWHAVRSFGEREDLVEANPSHPNNEVGNALGRLAAGQELGPYLFASFAFGFALYLLVPAIGPEFAYPTLFHHPLPQSTISRTIGTIIAKGSSRYDVFPSLHVTITCVLLDYDWRHLRRRFFIMILPAAGMILATVYLRFHYGIDLVAGVGLFVLTKQVFVKISRNGANGLR